MFLLRKWTRQPHMCLLQFQISNFCLRSQDELTLFSEWSELLHTFTLFSKTIISEENSNIMCHVPLGCAALMRAVVFRLIHLKAGTFQWKYALYMRPQDERKNVNNLSLLASEDARLLCQICKYEELVWENSYWLHPLTYRLILTLSSQGCAKVEHQWGDFQCGLC